MKAGTKGRLEDQHEVARAEAQVKETEARLDREHREPSDKPPTIARRLYGFAAMDPAKVSEIASKGGKAAHAAGTAHKFDSAEARAAGMKGGKAPHIRRGRGPVIQKKEEEVQQ